MDSDIENEGERRSRSSRSFLNERRHRNNSRSPLRSRSPSRNSSRSSYTSYLEQKLERLEGRRRYRSRTRRSPQNYRSRHQGSTSRHNYRRRYSRSHSRQPRGRDYSPSSHRDINCHEQSGVGGSTPPNNAADGEPTTHNKSGEGGPTPPQKSGVGGSTPPKTNEKTVSTTLDEDIIDLDPEVLNLFGQDPEMENIIKINIHKAIAPRWANILRKGLSKDEKEEILRKYPTPTNLETLAAPIVNPEITEILPSAASYKDKQLASMQNQLGACITALGVMSGKILNEETKFDRSIINNASEMGKALTDLFHSFSLQRRSHITPQLPSIAMTVARNTEIGKFLYEDFSTKLKSAKEVEAMGRGLKPKIKQLPKNLRGPPRKAEMPQPRQQGFRQGRKPYPRTEIKNYVRKPYQPAYRQHRK